jgi:hypothetical protein
MPKQVKFTVYITVDSDIDTDTMQDQMYTVLDTALDNGSLAVDTTEYDVLVRCPEVKEL